MPNLPDRARSMFWMLTSCVLFSGMSLFVATAHHIDPTLSTSIASFFRSGVNLLLLLLIARDNPRQLLGDGRWALWMRGLGGGLALLSYFHALSNLGVGEAAFLNQTSAVWVALFAPWILKEVTARATWLAIGISLLGMAFLGVPREGQGDAVARLVGAGSGLFSGFAYLAVRRASTSNRPITMVFYFTIVSTSLSGLVVFFTGAAFPTNPWVLLCLLGAGAAATCGQLAMTTAYQIGPAAPLAALSAAGPLLSTTLAWLVFAQMPDRLGKVGMTLVFLGAVALPFLNLQRRPTERH